MKVALDVDDVLAAFCLHTSNFYGIPLEKRDYWCVKTMNSVYGEGWFSKIAPIREFWETIPTLSNPADIDFDVDCYMSAFPEEMHDIRVEWLKKNGFPNAPLIVTFDKLEKCTELGITHLVDDKPATIQKLQGSSAKGIHFITDYAGFDPIGNFITNLKQVKNYL